ncbi:MAG TPA: putative selenium-dependent hydroxylase accessory protein YqeC [Firmicutes bacterium]|nr:putative selenium-dependent hydroxylase accessory protein YqeC [Bacillota bacterium]
MKQLSLSGVLNQEYPAVISFYGAGGKTSLIKGLAAEISACGQKVLITTTTKIFIPPGIPLILGSNEEQILRKLEEHYRHSAIAVLASAVLPSGKLKGIAPAAVELIRRKLNLTVLVEADGAGRLPLKGHLQYEPVIPEKSDLIIPVIGADALGKALDHRTAHRADILAASIGVSEGTVINEEILARIFKYLKTAGRQQARHSRVVPVINKADLLDAPGKTAWRTAEKIEPGEAGEIMLITAALDEDPVKFVLNFRHGHPSVMVNSVILAAGTSSRMGRDKLLLPFGGETVLGHTLKQIKQSGIGDPIVVVRPEQCLTGMLEEKGYRFVINEDYRSGIAGSLKAGMKAVDSCSQAILFALADQPLIPPALYRQIIDKYMKNFKPVTCPCYAGKRGNPVIFDRRTWPSLMKLQGDSGGREILKTIPPSEIDYLTVDTKSILMDIDTEEDYCKLKDQLPKA